MKLTWTILTALCFSTSLQMTAVITTFGQETVFSIMKSDNRKASELFASKRYRQAARLYESMADRAPNSKYYLALARAHYYLHEPVEASTWYEKYLTIESELPANDVLLYAEALASQKKYDQAVNYYKQYEKLSDNDPMVMKKIWQIKNRNYLLEDSLHYTIKRLDCNKPSADIAAVPYENGFVFLSNRARPSVIKNVDEGNSPFFRWYQSTMKTDSTGIIVHYGEPVSFFEKLQARYQLGPVSFFDNERQMAFIASNADHQLKGKRPLQLFFAVKGPDGWQFSRAFDFNGANYSITSVTVREDGKVLYLSSDMGGGQGGLDLYQSTFDGKAWSKPKNLGNEINTVGDEAFPSISGNSLSFSSNGLPGLGGFDVFSVMMSDRAIGEVQNMGYPVNTNFDDFALSLNADRSKGYLTSNRNGGDDIYEVTIDLQTYPFTIAGVLKYKEENWRESETLTVYPLAELELIDNLKGTVVARAVSDAKGEFNLTIPYFSQYRIKVTGSTDGDQAIVSLDLGKTRYGENRFELVVVKNSFKKDY
ncbi:tetratricopeptide repeat protein [Chryseolinea sp. T2]|uniref:tetratricopeptide repeat protein n=1 Tax=Chryseolinea sp. T2 TaxID=3129255 RepID=UPI003077CD48